KFGDFKHRRPRKYHRHFCYIPNRFFQRIVKPESSYFDGLQFPCNLCATLFDREVDRKLRWAWSWHHTRRTLIDPKRGCWIEDRRRLPWNLNHDRIYFDWRFELQFHPVTGLIVREPACVVNIAN